MPADAVAQHEIDRLTAEVERLRTIEGTLFAERERIRADSAAEIGRLQDALRAAAGSATVPADPRESVQELAERGRHVAERERGLREREAALDSFAHELAALEQRIANEREALSVAGRRLDAERSRLAGERRRLEQESDRLAEWEREALRGGPSTPLPMTFHEGLGRLAEPGIARRTPPKGSW